jgi:chorismate mutase
VWKPRTSPSTFQGAGAQALTWLAEVKRTYGMAIATEVATPEHVAAALEAGVDYLWIGARTSANPLAVQAIADSLSNRSNPNILSNPNFQSNQIIPIIQILLLI